MNHVRIRDLPPFWGHFQARHILKSGLSYNSSGGEGHLPLKYWKFRISMHCLRLILPLLRNWPKECLPILPTPVQQPILFICKIYLHNM